MLERIEGAKTKVGVATVALSTAVAVALDHALASQLRQWSAWLSVSAVAVSACALQFGAEAAINRSRRLRRFIAGDDYIEGTWLEIYRPAGAKEDHYGVVTIAYHEGKIALSGFTYRGPVDSAERGVWRSEASHYCEGKLVYFYEEIVDNTTITGSGRLDFNMVGGFPLRYLSKFFSPLEAASASGRGFRLDARLDMEAVRKGGHALEALLRKYSEAEGEQISEADDSHQSVAQKRWHEI